MFHYGSVVSVSEEGILELRVPEERGGGVVRVKLWEVETDPWTLRFLLLDREVRCQKISGTVGEGPKGYDYGVCGILLQEEPQMWWSFNRFINESVKD